MGYARARTLVAVVATVVIVASCSSSKHPDAASSSAARSTATTSAPAGPNVGLVAIGHTGLTGYETNPKEPDQDVPANSWATGTNPAVDSIYQRLVKVDPTVADHVSNQAVDGAEANALLGQVGAALKKVPHPQLVIIQTIDYDVACDGSDAQDQSYFAQGVRSALNLIVAKSPTTKILTMSEFGRPAEYLQAVKGVSYVQQVGEGTGMCDPFDDNGKYVPAHTENLLKIIELYEKTLASVCGQIPTCTYSDAPSHYVDKLANLTTVDYGHQNVAGLAAWSAVMWPVVAKTLGVSAN